MPFTTAAIIAGTTATTVSAAGAGAAIVGGTAITTTAAWGATAATIAADAALVTGGVGAFSSIMAGKEAEQLSKDQAAISAYNVALDKQEAVEKQSAAGIRESDFRKSAEAYKAGQRTGYAKAGVTPEGSPMDFLEEQAIRLEIDALRIRRTGTVAAESLQASSELHRIAGRNALARGRNRRRASYITAAGQGIGGLGRSINQRQSLS